MCFYNDYEWSASVSEKKNGPAAKDCKCDECGCAIAAGEPCLMVHQQEHEQCQICEDEDSDAFVDPADRYDDGLTGADALAGHTCDFGEVFDYVCCDKCDKFRRAIIEHERKEGCPPDSRQPSYCGMYEELGWHDDRGVYVDAALVMFPELASFNPVTSLRVDTE